MAPSIPESNATQPWRYLHVENKHWHDMTVYLMRGATALRLGVVGSNMSWVFTLPPAYIGNGWDLRLRAVSRGAVAVFTSTPFVIGPGGVHLILERNLRLSTFVVR